MAYRIEITAETLSELAGKTLALAAQFQTTAADPVMPEVKAATRKAKPTKVEEPQVEQADEGKAQTASSEPASSGETEASQTVEKTPEAASEPEIDVVRDVQPLVLAAVAKIGKERASEIIKTYGAERVTQVEADKLPALIAELKEILG